MASAVESVAVFPAEMFRINVDVSRGVDAVLTRWVEEAAARVEQATAGGNPEAIRCAQAAYAELVASIAKDNGRCAAGYRQSGIDHHCSLQAGHTGLHDADGFTFSYEIEAGRQVR